MLWIIKLVDYNQGKVEKCSPCHQSTKIRNPENDEEIQKAPKTKSLQRFHEDKNFTLSRCWRLKERNKENGCELIRCFASKKFFELTFIALQFLAPIHLQTTKNDNPCRKPDEQMKASMMLVVSNFVILTGRPEASVPNVSDTRIYFEPKRASLEKQRDEGRGVSHCLYQRSFWSVNSRFRKATEARSGDLSIVIFR
jgi:hypothetical protein